MLNSSAKDILVIEDDVNLGFFLQKFLEMRNFRVKYCRSGGEGLKHALTNRYDLFLVDIGLPEVSGFDIVKEVRNLNNTKPIIIITDKIEIGNEISSFKLGVNIFHRKPINYQLLESQITAVFKQTEPEDVIKFCDLELNLTQKSVTKGSQRIDLTYSEYSLLLLFIKSQSKIFSRDEIIRKVFNNTKDVEFGAVDTLVSRLRKKIGTYKNNELIETVYKAGYRLNATYCS